MRRFLFVIAIFVLLCSCGNREKYARLLAEADSLNQNYIRSVGFTIRLH